MPSEKLRKILLAISPFPPEQIDLMSEGEGWQWIYARSRARNPEKNKTQVCFTGFSAKEREELHQLAKDHNMEPVTSCTVRLVYLVTGPNAGPAKLAKARELEAIILTKKQYEDLLETGEVPEGCF